MKKLIVANWKMNPESLREAKNILRPLASTSRRTSHFRSTTVVICPPSVFLPALVGSYGKYFSFGGQDAFWETVGPFTGEISPRMLKSIGAEYVILGHSERRSRPGGVGETSSLINQKARAALRLGLKVILCVGETARDGDGGYLKIIRAQLVESLARIHKSFFKNLIVAYEPVWAIGREVADTPADFLEQSIFIRKVLTELADKKIALATAILYGGSVTVENAGHFLREGAAGGLLVGHHSLRPAEFKQIVLAA